MKTIFTLLFFISSICFFVDVKGQSSVNTYVGKHDRNGNTLTVKVSIYNDTFLVLDHGGASTVKLELKGKYIIDGYDRTIGELNCESEEFLRMYI